jgi:hypothetical protein
MDPDPTIFIIDLKMPAKNKFFNTISACYFLKIHLHNFLKIRSQKESQNGRIQEFSYYFCMMIEESGSIPLTCGSGSGRPKNTWLRWIRIRNTVYNNGNKHHSSAQKKMASPHLDFVVGGVQHAGEDGAGGEGGGPPGGRAQESKLSHPATDQIGS